jgi:hypothetical protein
MGHKGWPGQVRGLCGLLWGSAFEGALASAGALFVIWRRAAVVNWAWLPPDHGEDHGGDNLVVGEGLLMHRLLKFFSIEDPRYEQVKELSDQELSALWLGLDQKRHFFRFAFSLSIVFLLLITLANALRTGDVIALFAAIAVAATGFFSSTSNSAFAVADREQHRREVLKGP